MALPVMFAVIVPLLIVVTKIPPQPPVHPEPATAALPIVLPLIVPVIVPLEGLPEATLMASPKFAPVMGVLLVMLKVTVAPLILDRSIWLLLFVNEELLTVSEELPVVCWVWNRIASALPPLKVAPVIETLISADVP